MNAAAILPRQEIASAFKEIVSALAGRAIT